MPKIPESLVEESVNPVIDTIISNHQKLTVTTEPIITIAVGRKINIGNFENVDVMVCLTVPLSGVDPSDSERLSDAVKKAAAEAFSLASRETGERYQLIKDSQQKG